jgi:spermidine synthase
MDARLSIGYSHTATAKLNIAFFAGALFTSAGLLFWVQPLIAKMLLPLLGGAPAVWNTCMVFFQAMLLAGYAYALVLSRFKLRKQILIHIALLILAGVLLPFSIRQSFVSELSGQANPVLWMLKVLAITIGFPFFVLSASAPLLQRWFSHSSHASAKDPYFLYAISNAGSMLSLLAFPFFLEPRWDLANQSTMWAGGYLLLGVLISACAFLIFSANDAARPQAQPVEQVEMDVSRPALLKRLEWVFLAFIPSSLMLGVTTHISTDVASVPLIWIIPLALYLLTFIIAFAKKQVISLKLVTLLIPAAIIALTFLGILKPRISVWAIIGCHLVIFFLIAFACHRRLALARPGVNRLADYYLCISVGGVLGGILNALIAPLVFSTPLEYPLIMILACLMLPGGVLWSRSWLRFAFPVAAGALSFGLALLMLRSHVAVRPATVLVVGVPLLIAYVFASRQRVAFTLSLLAIGAGGFWYSEAKDPSLLTERSFFGVWRVTANEKNKFMMLRHGTTDHGGQFTDAARRCTATTYFHNEGPVGQVFQNFNAHGTSNNVAVVGLGAGILANYSRPNEKWDYYEIDPTVVRIARDSGYFTFLTECAKSRPNMILGDARLKLKEATDGRYGLLIMDAFSSDSIPAHLATVEAMDLYLSKLAPDGMLAFQISNRYLNLEPLLSGLAQEKGMVARIRTDTVFDNEKRKLPSIWVVMSRQESALADIVTDARWKPLNGHVVWTDEFSNMLDLLR